MSEVESCAGFGGNGVALGGIGVIVGVGVMVGTAVSPGTGVLVGEIGIGVFVSIGV